MCDDHGVAGPVVAPCQGFQPRWQILQNPKEERGGEVTIFNPGSIREQLTVDRWGIPVSHKVGKFSFHKVGNSGFREVGNFVVFR